MAHERGSAGREGTANDRFKRSYRDWFSAGMIAAVLAHFAFLQLFPSLTAADLRGGGEEMEAIELPPEVKIPPPPEEIARPASPKIAEAQIDEDVTIAPTTFEENPVEKLPPPPKAGSVRDRPSWVPHDVKPRPLNIEQIKDKLRAQYPSLLREAGIAARVVLWLFVDESGDVQEARVQESSGYKQYDRVAREVALGLRCTPAMNRDKPVGVWISMPFKVQSQK